jgi:hypothetical protein
MVSKLLTLLSTFKGAAAATVVAAAAVGTGVVASNQDVQNAVGTTLQNVTQAAATPSGQPAVVAARNDADKKLRDAFQNDQQLLEKLHSTHVDSTDRAKLDTTVNTAADALRARLDKALNDVAALTLGREGLESPKPTGSPDIKIAFTAQSQIDTIVSDAIKAMDTIEKDAETTVLALPTTAPGKPADAGKPATVPTPPAHP